MITVSLEKIDLGIDPQSYSHAESLDLSDVALKGLIPGRRGKASIRTVQAYANPAQGYRPFAGKKTRLVLPTILISGTRRTMPAWVEAFVRQMVQLGQAKNWPANVRPLLFDIATIQATRSRDPATRAALPHLAAETAGDSRRSARARRGPGRLRRRGSTERRRFDGCGWSRASELPSAKGDYKMSALDMTTYRLACYFVVPVSVIARVSTQTREKWYASLGLDGKPQMAFSATAEEQAEIAEAFHKGSSELRRRETKQGRNNYLTEGYVVPVA